MTTEKRKTGDRGEKYAAAFLEKNGYKIIEKNYSARVGEVDIIATNYKFIVFAEVKTRAGDALMTPAEAVNVKKQRRIIKTAEVYLATHRCRLQPRFDVIEIFTDDIGTPLEINHLENAFWAGGFNG